MDTSLLRAACWTMASGVKLEKHVKAQCGEAGKVDWCCEILSESGVPCGLRFRSKKALRCHQLRSRSYGHGLQTSIFASVITNSCPWCRSTFATTLIARKLAAAAMLSGHCRVDAGAFPWPISPPLSLQCRLCDDGDNYAFIDDFYDYAVALHLPEPSPVSLPIATALHHACGTSGTIRDTSCEGRDHGRGGEETTTDTSDIGSWRTWLGTTERGSRGRRTKGRGRSRGLQKEARRFLQEHHAADGHHHQAVPADRTGHTVSMRRPLRHNHHGHGTRRREEHAGADAAVQRERADSRTRTHAGTAADLERTAAVGSSTQVRQSSSDTVGARTAAVAGHPTRQVEKDETLLSAVSAWLGERGNTPRNPRWMTMVRSEAVQRMALAARGNALFPLVPATPAFSMRRREVWIPRGLLRWVVSLLTAKGVPPPSCLGISAPGSAAASKTAGDVDVVGTSLRAEMRLDQQLSEAFQAGLRHLLDDADHDAMFDLSGNEP